ncbi:DUF2062 domain-containing protein [Candidatus Enterovibrio escicola]|uniref:DUF2062 domain-containing protein n=2 Tax=Candidatus Enterovibrio escicola TaxID=1927127 RepID=A0A2A5T860_9GAMM|nr:DUF2062 domain-containing protein [Candidatus Enterovibrio escacola]PCS24280.1 hypothetical protein BTN49_0098 [Candidatus Enterovibrio escacola]
MPKKIIKKYLPKNDIIHKFKSLALFGNLLYNQNLWCLNRQSASGAFAVGLFMAFVPLPCQMIMAAGLAIMFGVNLPLSVALVWITNPVTMPVIFYGAYKLGSFLLNRSEQHFHFELSGGFLMHQMSKIGPPFLLGSLILGIVFSLLGYFIVRGIWRYAVIRNWKKRRLRLPKNLTNVLKKEKH